MLLVLDLIVVAAFVLIGRATHEEGVLAVGTLHALWPFLVSLHVGWLLTTPWLRPGALRGGTLIWIITLVLGFGLRAVSGQGTALPFLVVATLVLGLGMLGWRLVRLLLRGGAEPG